MIRTCLLPFLFWLPAMRAEVPAPRRDLQLADWAVIISAVTGQSIQYSTGVGAGRNPNIKIGITDLCRQESTTRTTIGTIFHSSTVAGIAATSSGVGDLNDPGMGKAISFSFGEGISENAGIYKDNGDSTATVKFCAEVGLYQDTILVNFADVKLTYSIDLVSNIPTLSSYTVTHAEHFNDATEMEVSFEGTVAAYFCDPTTKAELTIEGLKISQGHVLFLCFRVLEGSYEVAEVIDLTVTNAGASTPTQDILSSTLPSSTLYATQDCTNDVGMDTNVCVVSFLLKDSFYNFHALTLAGTATVLLELGDAATKRRRRVLSLAGRQIEERLRVKAQKFQVERRVESSSAASEAMSSLTCFFVLAMAALVL